MKIYTNTALVKKAREGVMEFLACESSIRLPDL
jgi:NADH dehydrogenase/NADH:ubiquinone oxidoreductase subunit G